MSIYQIDVYVLNLYFIQNINEWIRKRVRSWNHPRGLIRGDQGV